MLTKNIALEHELTYAEQICIVFPLQAAAADHSRHAAGHCWSAADHIRHAAGHGWSIADHSRDAVGHCWSVAGHSRHAAGHGWSIADHSRDAVGHRWSVAGHSRRAAGRPAVQCCRDWAAGWQEHDRRICVGKERILKNYFWCINQ